MHVDEADDERDDDRHQRGQDHLALRGLGDEVDAGRVVGLLGALHDPRLLAELAAHLLDDGAAGAADGLHRERGEQVDHQAAEQQAHEDRRVVDREHEVLARVGELVLEAGEQHDRGEHGRADRVALGHGLGGVADRVERVGHVADLFGQVGHLGDAARVVGDRAERVERDDQAGQRQLAHDRHADAVDTGQLPGDEDAEHEHERRQRRGLQALEKPWMMFVAWPVCDAAAVFLTGPKRVEV